MDDFRRRIQRESSRAPGLPYPPLQSHLPGRTSSTRYLQVSSVNYDYLPMCLDSPKVFWVDLIRPAPDDLLVGTPVRLHITPDRGIQTEMSRNSPRNSVFEVTDIVGSRVILSPYRGSAWLPTVHSSCDNPMGWGYNMRITNVSPSIHSTKYGYGAPVSYLEYNPIYASPRATNLEAAQMQEDFYRSTRFIPGWQHS